MQSAPDVVIVGGGPAGASSAIALQRLGVQCRIYDAQRFPRDKVCGDVLLPTALSALEALGLDLARLQTMAYECQGASYTSPSGDRAADDYRDLNGRAKPWWIVKRAVFDAWLLNQAQESGAEVLTDCRVTAMSQFSGGLRLLQIRRADGTKEEVTARVVIGADGASSIIAKSLGFYAPRPSNVCLAARAYVSGVTLDRPHMEVFTTRRTLPGCAWILPVGPREANVGLGIIQADAQRLSVTPQSLFAEVVAETPALARHLKNASFQLKGWWLPGATEGRPLVADGCLLAGDAGAMIDPFTGHGIHHALKAAKIAGEVIAAALRSGDCRAAALGPYSRRCHDQFLRVARRGKHLQRSHSCPQFSNLVTHLAARNRGISWMLMALLGHSEPRARILSPMQITRALAGRIG